MHGLSLFFIFIDFLMFRVEEYIRRNLHQCIVEPYENMIYTRRKLHFLRSSNSVGESSNAGIQPSSDTAACSNTLTMAQIPKLPSDGWGISLEKAPHFIRVEMDKHVARSGKIWALECIFLFQLG